MLSRTSWYRCSAFFFFVSVEKWWSRSVSFPGDDTISSNAVFWSIMIFCFLLLVISSKVLCWCDWPAGRCVVPAASSKREQQPNRFFAKKKTIKTVSDDSFVWRGKKNLNVFTVRECCWMDAFAVLDSIFQHTSPRVIRRGFQVIRMFGRTHSCHNCERNTIFFLRQFRFFFLVTPLIGIIETDLGRRDRSAPPFMDMFTLGERARFFIK